MIRDDENKDGDAVCARYASEAVDIYRQAKQYLKGITDNAKR